MCVMAHRGEIGLAWLAWRIGAQHLLGGGIIGSTSQKKRKGSRSFCEFFFVRQAAVCRRHCSASQSGNWMFLPFFFLHTGLTSVPSNRQTDLIRTFVSDLRSKERGGLFCSSTNWFLNGDNAFWEIVNDVRRSKQMTHNPLTYWTGLR